MADTLREYITDGYRFDASRKIHAVISETERYTCSVRQDAYHGFMVQVYDSTVFGCVASVYVHSKIPGCWALSTVCGIRIRIFKDGCADIITLVQATCKEVS